MPIDAIIVVQVGGVAQGVEHEAFGQYRDQGDRCGRTGHRHPVMHPEAADQIKRDEGAGHVKGAVGEVGYMQDAVHEREAKGHEAVDAAQRQPVQDLLQK